MRRLSSRVVYRNPWMAVREDRVARQDGSHGIYGFVVRPDFAVVIPAERDGFHLVQEYRYPIGRRTWSFPQGSHPGEDLDAETLARAELAEETGLRARAMTRLGYLHEAHGTASHGFTAFLATGLIPGPTAREHTEQDMEQAFVTRVEFEAMVARGLVTDSSTLAAYTLLLLHERTASSAGLAAA